jgi:hypothetical protein
VEAGDWYQRALAIFTDLGQGSDIATSYGALGLLAEQQGDLRQALEWTVRCVTVFGEFPHPLTKPGPDHLMRLTAGLGIEILEETWRKVTGSALPQAVRLYVRFPRPPVG